MILLDLGHECTVKGGVTSSIFQGKLRVAPLTLHIKRSQVKMLPRHLLAEVFHAAYWTMQETPWLGEGNPEADLEQTGKFRSPDWLLNTSVSPMMSWKLVGGSKFLPGSHIQIKGRT